MICRVFFQLSDVEENISSSSPLDLSAAQVLDEVVPHLKTPDDYVGLMDAADNVLQIVRLDGSADFWVEVSVESERASYGSPMSLAELEALLQRLPSRFRPHNFPGFERRAW